MPGGGLTSLEVLTWHWSRLSAGLEFLNPDARPLVKGLMGITLRHGRLFSLANDYSLKPGFLLLAWSSSNMTW